MKEKEIIAQSKTALAQWGAVWRKHAEAHAQHTQKDLLAFQNSGIGKACLVIANGPSFEKAIPTIREHQANVDILVVDKCLKACLENGIKPTFVLVCDANVSYETYLRPVEDQLQDTVLLINVCANPEWSAHGNWKDRYFFVNKDCLKSEEQFIALSGCRNVIAAGTNVSNAAVVMLTQCDNDGRRNFFGYDKILTIGFDYCWTDETYYAFDRTGAGKRNYMKSVYVITIGGDFVFTSPNLLFSAKWIEKYVSVYKLPVVQCSRDSLVGLWRQGDLAEQMGYRYRPEDATQVSSLLDYRRKLQAEIEAVNGKITAIGQDHVKQLIRTV